jgi:hypothetical protein
VRARIRAHRRARRRALVDVHTRNAVAGKPHVASAREAARDVGTRGRCIARVPRVERITLVYIGARRARAGPAGVAETLVRSWRVGARRGARAMLALGGRSAWPCPVDGRSVGCRCRALVNVDAQIANLRPPGCADTLERTDVVDALASERRAAVQTGVGALVDVGAALPTPGKANVAVAGITG